MKQYRAMAAAVALFAAHPAFAFTIVDTGINPNADPNYGYLVNSDQSLAGKFSVAQSLSINSLESYMTQTSGTFRAVLYADSGGAVGAKLYEANFTGTLGWAGVSGVNWAVTQGDYWGAIEYVSGGSGGLANIAQTPLSDYAYKNSSTDNNWTSYPATNTVLRVTGTAAPTGGAPEPATWAMMIIGFGAAGTQLRRNRGAQSRALATA